MPPNLAVLSNSGYYLALRVPITSLFVGVPVNEACARGVFTITGQYSEAIDRATVRSGVTEGNSQYRIFGFTTTQ
jgi:hypothetical protein